MRWLVVLLAACGAVAPRGDAPRALGANDVSILLPLPKAIAAPVIATIDGMVSRDAYDQLITAHGDLGPKVGTLAAYDDVHLVAVRFDLCDRVAIGPCPAGVPGRLRLVLQPLEVASGELRTQDVAIHAFYPIAAAELAGVIGELRAMQQGPSAAPLQVSAAAGDARYRERLRALVTRYARADRLARLTVVGQLASSAAFAWAFRGIERAPTGDFVAMAIPGLDGATQQTALLAGGDTVFDARPVADAPAGFAMAINGATFAGASADARRGALEALIAIQDPRRHDTVDTQCLACHVATYLMVRRAAALHVALPRDTVDSVASHDPRVVRAFGWAGSAPAISQRVVQETTAVLAEIAARFPR